MRQRIVLTTGLLGLILFVFLGLSSSLTDNNENVVATVFQFIREESSRIYGRFISVSDEKSFSKKNGRKNDQKKDSGKIVGTALVTVQDRRQRTIEGATVVFQSVIPFSKPVKAVTDKRGRIRQNLNPGLYRVAVTHSRFSPQEFGVHSISSIGKGFTLICSMDVGIKLKGSVLNEEGKPITDAVIRGKKQWMEQFSEGAGVFLDDSSYAPSQSDHKGQFELDQISVGDNIIEISKYGYAPETVKINVRSGSPQQPLKIILKRPATITGKIINENSENVKGVKVTATVYKPYSGIIESLSKQQFSTVTDNEGNFTLKKLFDGGSYDIQIEHSTYATGYFNSVSANTSNLIWTIERGGKIAGTIRYLDRPTTAAQVLISATAVISGTTHTKTIKSNAAGKFTFNQLPFGVYTLNVEDKGIVSEPMKRIPVLKDKPVLNAHVEVYKAGNLKGKVIDVLNDQPLSGAQITVNVTYGFSRVRTRKFSAKSDSSGEFGIGHLPGGMLKISSELPDYIKFNSDAADSRLALEPGKTLSDYIIGMSQGGIVTGMVVDMDERPIAGVDVQLFVASGSFNRANLSQLKTVSDGSGFFEVSGIEIGQQLSLYGSGIKDGFAKKRSDLIELYPTYPEAVTKIVMSPGGIVTGQVTNSRKEPVSNAEVVYESREFPGDPSPSKFVVNTSPSGVFIIDKCTPGQIRVSVKHQDYVTLVKNTTINEGKLTRLNFQLRESLAISGFVADYNGKPIADATVRAIPGKGATGTSSDKTDRKGDFRISGVSSGEFRLEASFNRKTPEGTQAYTFTVPKIRSNTYGVPIDCDLTPSVSARVLDENGRSVENFNLLFKQKDNTVPEQNFRLRISRPYKNSGGLLRIMHVPRGLYNLEIEAPGYEKYIDESVAIGSAGRNVLKTIRLKSSSAIKGTLVNSINNKPINGALIRVLDLSKKSVQTVNRLELRDYDRSDIIEYLDSMYDDNIDLDPDPWKRLVARVRGNVILRKHSNFMGEFKIDGISYGSYTIEIEHPDYIGKNVSNITVSKDQTKDLDVIALDPGGSIRGNVSDDEGNGLNNTAVEIIGERAGRNRARTDIGGNYRVRGVGFGEWLISARTTLNTRKVYAIQSVQSRPNHTNVVNFVFDTKASLSGSILLRDGYANSGTVRLYVPDGLGSFVGDIVYTGSIKNQAFQITNIPSGRYLAVYDGRGQSGTFSGWEWITIGKGNNRQTIRAGSSSFGGEVNVSSGRDLSDIRIRISPEIPGVKLIPAISNILQRTITVNSKTGKFSSPYLKEGSWRIWVQSDSGLGFYPVDLISLAPGQAFNNYRLSVP